MIRLIALIVLSASTLAAQTFNLGDSIRTTGTPCVNVRPIPGPSTPLDCKTPGTRGVIKGGPTMWGSQPYYQVLYSDGLLGWSAGIYLQFVAPAPPAAPPPAGTFQVTPIIDGKTTISFSGERDTLSFIRAIPNSPYFGSLTVQLSSDATFDFVLQGPGGSTTYSASTANGTPLPPAGDLKRMLDSAYNAGIQAGIPLGKVLVGVDSVDVWLSNGRRFTK